MAIAFDPKKISEASGLFNIAYNLIDPQLVNLMTNIDSISNPVNWSGPIADSAKDDLNNAKNAIESIRKNMGSIYSILSEAASNFEKIGYK